MENKTSIFGTHENGSIPDIIFRISKVQGLEDEAIRCLERMSVNNGREADRLDAIRALEDVVKRLNEISKDILNVKVNREN